MICSSARLRVTTSLRSTFPSGSRDCRRGQLGRRIDGQRSDDVLLLQTLEAFDSVDQHPIAQLIVFDQRSDQGDLGPPESPPQRYRIKI
ncbi:MAG: hypothetical protein IPJ06_00375 [Saprospiraceae bacterium]|nr:hypothetical protein [Saprospiraceae bacterium]